MGNARKSINVLLSAPHAGCRSLPHSRFHCVEGKEFSNIKALVNGDLCLRNPKSLVLALMLAIAAGQPAARADIPSFWDAKQRLAKPDMTPFQRLRFLTTTDFFPFNFLDTDRRLNGLHIDLARAICSELGMLDRCQIQALPFEELESALQRGDGEAVIAGLAITAESREKFLFSRSYMMFPARFVTRRDVQLSEPIYKAIAGKRVGVVSGTAHETMLRDLFTQATLVSFPGERELENALTQGSVDAIFGDGMRLSFWLPSEAAKNCCVFVGGAYIAPEYLGRGLAIAVRSDQPTLAQALNYALQEIDADGTLSDLYLRYFPVNFY